MFFTNISGLHQFIMNLVTKISKIFIKQNTCNRKISSPPSCIRPAPVKTGTKIPGFWPESGVYKFVTQRVCQKSYLADRFILLAL